MKTKHSIKSVLSGFLATVIMIGTIPAVSVSAAQSNEYIDPADVWLETNSRTSELMSADGQSIEKMVGHHKRVSNISARLANTLLENGADIAAIRRFAGVDWSPEADMED